jgi:hypothetical protein
MTRHRRYPQKLVIRLTKRQRQRQQRRRQQQLPTLTTHCMQKRTTDRWHVASLGASCAQWHHVQAVIRSGAVRPAHWRLAEARGENWLLNPGNLMGLHAVVETTAGQHWKIVFGRNVLRVWKPIAEVDARLELPPHTILPRASRRTNAGVDSREQYRPEAIAAQPQWGGTSTVSPSIFTNASNKWSQIS